MSDKWEDVGTSVEPASQPEEIQNGSEVTYWEEEIPVAEKVLVRLLNTDEFNGRRLIEVIETGEVLLVPSDKVAYAMHEQEIEKSALSLGEKPYNWDEEIDQIVLTKEQIRRALWMEGLVSESDSPKPKSLRGILNKLLSRGGLPVVQE